jgi:hypothetical protein
VGAGRKSTVHRVRRDAVPAARRAPTLPAKSKTLQPGPVAVSTECALIRNRERSELPGEAVIRDRPVLLLLVVVYVTDVARNGHGGWRDKPDRINRS